MFRFASKLAAFDVIRIPGYLQRGVEGVHNILVFSTSAPTETKLALTDPLADLQVVP